MGYIYIIGTVFFTVYGQLIVKWQVSKAGNLPLDINGKISFFTHLLSNFWIISAFLAAFLASLSWMAAMTKFELSFAYPFTSVSFVLVLVSSAVFFNEAISLSKVMGLVLIIFGIIVGSQ